MIGPDHYLEAQQWLRYAADLYRNGNEQEVPAGQLAAAIAQGHAQLAAAAAIAELDARPVGETGGAATGRAEAYELEWERVLVHDPDPELEDGHG